MTIAHSYLRYSTPEQALGDSERRQVEKARLWAAANGHDYDDSYRDPGVSAFRGRHRAVGALARFLDDVRSGRIPKGDLLIVESFDRLSREEPLKAFDLFREIIEHEITLVTGFASGSPQSYNKERLKREHWLLHVVLGEMSRAHSESQHKSERQLESYVAKRRLAREKKFPMTAQCPHWIMLVGEGNQQHYELNPEKAPIIRRIVRDTISGLGKWKICIRFNEEDVPSPTGKSGWKPSTISRILASESLIGIYQPRKMVAGRRVPEGDPIPEYFPAVVSEAEFWQARQATESRRKIGGRKGESYANLVTTLGFCEICGGRLTYVDKGSGPKGGKTLRCSNGKRGRCTNRSGYPYDLFERDLLHLLPTHMMLVPEKSDGNTSMIRVTELEAVLNRQKTTQQHLIDAFQDGDPIEVVTDRVRRLDAEIKKTQRELVEARKAAKISEHRVRQDFVERICEAHRLLASDDPKRLYDVRAKLAQEMRHVVEKVTLHDAHHISIQTKSPDGSRLRYDLTRDGVSSLTAFQPEGWSCRIDSKVFERAASPLLTEMTRTIYSLVVNAVDRPPMTLEDIRSRLDLSEVKKRLAARQIGDREFEAVLVG
jgi:DNA invertase Pin-like site-specific DNA recombinase